MKVGGFKGFGFKRHSLDWVWAPHCAACGRGAPFERPHTHLECPWVATLNKLRAQAGVKPLHITDGGIVRDDSPVEVDLPKKVKELTSLVDAFRSRVEVIEKHLGLEKKRKADAPPTASTSSTGGNQPPSKKAKKGGKKGGAGGGQPDPKGKGKGQDKGGEGKGKGKGKAQN